MARRTAAERKTDLVLIAELYTKNMSVRSIADQLNSIREYEVSFKTIHKDIQLIRKEWQEKREQMLTDHAAIELEKSMVRERKLWEQWQKSGEVRKKTKVKKKGRSNSQSPTDVEMQTAEEQGLGYYKYMELMQRESDFRCKLLGSYAPTKVDADITGNFFLQLMMDTTAEDNEDES